MVKSLSLMRGGSGHENGKVTFIELFFDLVFVFAVTQLSHYLLEHFSLIGALHTLFLLMAVWWVWIFTSWVTNWLDPEKLPVRIALIGLMLTGLILSTSIPDAFGERALTFAIAYVFIQVGRTAFMVWGVGKDHQDLRLSFVRILVWLIVSGVFWIAGGIVESQMLRYMLWILALVLEYMSPSVGFWVPRLGCTPTSVWKVEGAHFAERCGLFVIIALGESILVTGSTFSTLPWTSVNLFSFMITFVGSVAMWWIYFDSSAHSGHHKITHSNDPGRLARLAYTYLHLPIAAGIIVTAVGDELVLAHPLGHMDTKTICAIVGGPAIYLIGNTLFKREVTGKYCLPYILGTVALLLCIFVAHSLSPLVLGLLVTILLVVVGVSERLIFKRRRAAV
ncbi:low temperature requirement protein A [Paenibacillus sp. FSL H7-0331]|uniref:low temperature requirement protein A n=1 Tax=Paenibacillus sp. FSL H7-0331 TaxID=1920421 RepID=UPI00096C3CDB|nr:low temperature requirement protein A [Paenibacillus sp. FSL H7-0331]OMF20068.1 hypothetical protein BK127_04050 [Paenibacillus sp. FSL H7-0331]